MRGPIDGSLYARLILEMGEAPFLAYALYGDELRVNRRANAASSPKLCASDARGILIGHVTDMLYMVLLNTEARHRSKIRHIFPIMCCRGDVAKHVGVTNLLSVLVADIQRLKTTGTPAACLTTLESWRRRCGVGAW